MSRPETLWRATAETGNGDEWTGAWKTSRAVAERQARGWHEHDTVDRVWLEWAEVVVAGSEEVPG